MDKLMTPCRKAFEGWAESLGESIARTGGSYDEIDTHKYWVGFRAAWGMQDTTTISDNQEPI